MFFSLSDNECNVWDVGEDSGTNIRVDPKKGVVAATFNKLVEKITSEKDHGEKAESVDHLETNPRWGGGGAMNSSLSRVLVCTW